jgi:hypothetical protein
VKTEFQSIGRSVNVLQNSKFQHPSSKEIPIIKFPSRRAAALNAEV